MADTEQDRAELAKQRGRIAATITDPKKRQAYVSAQGNEESRSRFLFGNKKGGEIPRAMRTNSTTDTVLGSFKRGGKVKKTGLYKLHAKERVVPAKKGGKA